MFFKKVKKADLEAVSSRNADQERQENKMMRAWISFGVVIILLILLFFASINIGSLKVGFGELFSGLFVKYNKDVIPGGSEKSTGRSGNYRYLKRGKFYRCHYYGICTNTIFLHTDRSICRWCGRIFHGVLSVMEGWFKSDENYLNWCGSK